MTKKMKVLLEEFDDTKISEVFLEYYYPMNGRSKEKKKKKVVKEDIEGCRIFISPNVSKKKIEDLKKIVKFEEVDSLDASNYAILNVSGSFDHFYNVIASLKLLDTDIGSFRNTWSKKFSTEKCTKDEEVFFTTLSGRKDEWHENLFKEFGFKTPIIEDRSSIFFYCYSLSETDFYNAWKSKYEFRYKYAGSFNRMLVLIEDDSVQSYDELLRNKHKVISTSSLNRLLDDNSHLIKDNSIDIDFRNAYDLLFSCDESNHVLALTLLKRYNLRSRLEDFIESFHCFWLSSIKGIDSTKNHFFWRNFSKIKNSRSYLFDFCTQ